MSPPLPPGGSAVYEIFTDVDNNGLTLIDQDRDTSGSDIAYEYTVSIYDQTLDRIINFDPKIINRASAGS